ncbi:FHA domain-containing protein [Crocosphaera sp.]|uniref:FHA domain-containing protein n=1 Tax=Crocosphaera sp. TaxID=2729996 RepID=UPI002626910A|nr:FHA domain-containing protein [Crocosphaera sp.]MDJ0581791.1 FHA domain-containing protein [Crocosphaera sp.]
MITLTLLHPTKTTPIQNWKFETTATIRIGRSNDNEVVLFSAVVSRHHLEIRHEKNHWELVSVGTNGTYIEGKLVSQQQVTDGMMIRLASSGPTIKICLSSEESSVKSQLAQINKSHSSSPVQNRNPSTEDTIPSESRVD